ncbi:unnamed protein product, partial [Ectocarpus sp. 6 AP-2014]
ATAGFSSVVTDVPAGSSRLFLSFVVTDPAEALAETGPDTVFALQVSNFVCVPQLTITLEWFDEFSDVDLFVTEPGGTVVSYRNYLGDVGTLDNDDVDGYGPENYVLYSGLDTGVSSVLGDYVAYVNLFSYVNLSSGSGVSWRLTARVSGDVVWIEEGDLASSGDSSADFTVSLTEYAPGC